MGFDPAEEVFDLVSGAVVSAVIGGRVQAASFGRDTTAGVPSLKLAPENIGIKTLVGDHPPASELVENWHDRMLVVLGSGREAECHRPAMLINQRRKLGVETALGPSHRLRLLAASGIGTVLVELDVRAIQVTQSAAGSPAQNLEQPRKEAGGAPPPEAGVDRTPRPETLWQVSPWHPRSQDKPDSGENQPILFRRASPHCEYLKPAGFGPTQLNFFSRLHNGSGNE
jgi:hypothetical protein